MQHMPDQIQRMLDFYGLAQNPFGEDVDATVFSSAGDRSEIAEQLKHLLTFSPQDCLVMAPAGGGKTTLTHQVLKRLDEEWRVAWIDAREAEQLDVITRELIGQLGLGLKADGDTASLFRTIADVIAQRTADGENFLLVVQHADRLPLDVQQWLQSLRSLAGRPDTRLRQLWLASSATAIDQADHDDQWYALILEPFTGADAVTYLRDRFAGAGQLEGVPIEAKDVTRLNDMAGGIPGELNQIVQDYLIAGTFKTTERRQGFPLTHVLAGAAVVTLIVIAVLYGSRSDPEDATPAPVSSAPEEAPQSESSVQQRLAEAAARVEARRQEDDDDGGSQVDPGNGNDSPAAPVAEGTSGAEPPVPDNPEPEEGDEPVATASAAPAEAPETTSPEPQAAAPGDGWLASASDSTYTLQLLGVRDRAAIERVVADLDDPTGFRIVDSTYQGEPWYVLVYGQYNDAAAARADIASLPDAFNDQSPWPRTVASLRESMPDN